MLLNTIKRFLRTFSGCPVRHRPNLSGLSYWKERARIYGSRAVLNLGHTNAEVEAVTRYQMEIIIPHLVRSLRGDEREALDFGCGTGRFTQPIAHAIGGRAIGVDPIRTLVDLAPRAPNVEYRVSDGCRIPLADSSVDLVWVCLVLGGVPDGQLGELARELGRVLRPSGLLFLVENTSSKERCAHWTYRSVADYQRLLPFTALAHLHDYDDLGERISIMAGRKM